MSYIVQSWLRCTDEFGPIHGEELHRTWRVRHSSHAVRILRQARKDVGVCRVTLTYPASNTNWDLYRTETRDVSLDNSLRQLGSTEGTLQTIVLDVAPGVTQKELEKAVEDLVTRPGSL